MNSSLSDPPASFYSYSFLALHSLTFLLNFGAALLLWQVNGLNRNVYHLVVKTLVLSDTLSSLAVLIPSCIAHASSGWVGGHFTCTVFGYLSTMFLTWSAFLVLILCTLRYLAACKPFFYRERVKYSKLRIILVISLIWAALHLLLPAIGIGKFTLYTYGLYCAYDISHYSPSDKVLIHITVWEGLLFSSILFYFSISIVVVMRRRRKLSSSLSEGNGQSAKIQRWVKIQHGYTRMTLFIVAIFLFCGTPFLIYRLKVILTEEAKEKGHFIVQVIANLNPFLNPIVYIAFNRKYRHAVKAVRISLRKRRTSMVASVISTGRGKLGERPESVWTSYEWNRPKSMSMTKILNDEYCNGEIGVENSIENFKHLSTVEGKERGASTSSVFSVQFDNMITKEQCQETGNNNETPL